MEIRGRTYDGPDALSGFHEKRCSRAPGLPWEEGVQRAAALTRPESGTARGTCTPSHHAQLVRDSSSHRIPGALCLLLGSSSHRIPRALEHMLTESSSHRIPGAPEHVAHGNLFPQNPRRPALCHSGWILCTLILVCSATNFHLGSEPPRAWTHSRKAHPLFPGV